MEIQTLENAHQMLADVLGDIRILLSQIEDLKDKSMSDAIQGLLLQFHIKPDLNSIYTKLSEVSDFIIDPDAENADAGNHVTG